MAKRTAKKKAGRRKAPKAGDPATRLRKALVKRTKAELIEILLEFAKGDRGILRQLDAQLDLQPPVEELVIATRQAIADATDFDPRDINYNFDYDYEAYEAVKRNLTRLIRQGQLVMAMELSLELMRDGSRQVEMSDEGLMTEDIEKCLQVVIDALEKCELADTELHAWCAEMLASDRVGFICDRQLQALRDRQNV